MASRDMRRLLMLGAMANSTFLSTSIEDAPSRYIAWDLARPDPKPKKATKDRSKIKAARKQNRSRK